MNRESEESLAQHATSLDTLWASARVVLKKRWFDYDEKDLKNGNSLRSIELKRVVAPMIDHVEELLTYDLHMGNPETKELYEALEDLLVTTIARITRIDMSAGSRCRKKFLEGKIRSFQASAQLYWNELQARLISLADDGRR